MAKRQVDNIFSKVPDVPGIMGHPVEPEIIDGGHLENSDSLLNLPEWAGLSPVQRKIVAIKFDNPRWTKDQIAKEAGVGKAAVTKLYHSPAFAKISDEIAKVGKKELVMEAVNVMQNLLRAKSEQVRLKAAQAILADAGLMKDAPKESHSNKKIEVSWKAAPKTILGEVSKGVEPRSPDTMT